MYRDLRSSLEAEVDILVPTLGWLEGTNDLSVVLRQNSTYLYILNSNYSERLNYALT